MKHVTYACSTLLGILIAEQPVHSVAQVAEARSVILVRHAEATTGKARELTPAGLERAQELARVLKDAGITAIITTDTQRARDTAAPLAKAMNLKPQVFRLPNRDDDEAQRAQHRRDVEAAIRAHTGGTILVVGHETTVPAIIRLLGGPHLPNICPTVHDLLFVLIPERATARLIVARYGALTRCNS